MNLWWEELRRYKVHIKYSDGTESDLFRCVGYNEKEAYEDMTRMIGLGVMNVHVNQDDGFTYFKQVIGFKLGLEEGRTR
jgi:hypothetical protein